ncbi:homoserine O-acetyltransferase [Streptomyces fumigatiscleroticus]|nr:homoserine O-acetyltransferase [Streptomyces fumigatiscleroticus]
MTATPTRPAPAATVRTAHFTRPLPLARGGTLPAQTLAYETYGSLNARRDNAVLVCHSLTKDAHAAGRRAPGERPGWWDAAIGPGRLLDTDRYFVVSSATLAAPGSTGPATTDPSTGRPYGPRFPALTIGDMVDVQHRLVRSLGITRLAAVVGGCFGGQQALQWALRYPGAVDRAVVIGVTPATSAHTIALFTVMRRLIRSDPCYRGGDYYDGPPPVTGLGHAVAAAAPLWMSREALERRFGRRPAGPVPGAVNRAEFAVEEFLEHLADDAATTIDPNSLLSLMRAEEYFDLAAEYGDVRTAMARVRAGTLFVSYRGDWRYPAEETDTMHTALRAAGGRSRHVILDSPYGHGAFLFDVGPLARHVAPFLDTPATAGQVPR